MRKELTDKIIAYIMQQLSMIGENFGWQIGRVGANWENGYMKCNQDSKAHFRKDIIKRDIEKILEAHIVEVNKMIDQFPESAKKVISEKKIGMVKKCIFEECEHGEDGQGCYITFTFSDIGKTVFLTKEEAEAKLKELENV